MIGRYSLLSIRKATREEEPWEAAPMRGRPLSLYLGMWQDASVVLLQP